MPTYVAFLRAVNVGKRAYPMSELRAALESAGFEDVETHIQTGNVRVRTRMRSPEKVRVALERVFAEDRGFEVPTFVLSPDELSGLVADADSLDVPPPTSGQYVELLHEEPTPEARKIIEGQDRPGQRTYVRGRALHLLFDVPFHEAKPATHPAQRAIGESTNRNLKVMRALAEKWGA